MELEKQVVSLELAKRLKELGVPQESVFQWAAYETQDGRYLDEHYRIVAKGLQKYVDCYDDYIAALTVAGLGEMLGQFWSGKQGDSFQCKRWVHERDEATQVADTEADARAKMLCYLIENKLISLSRREPSSQTGKREG